MHSCRPDVVESIFSGEFQSCLFIQNPREYNKIAIVESGVEIFSFEGVDFQFRIIPRTMPIRAEPAYFAISYESRSSITENGFSPRVRCHSSNTL